MRSASALTLTPLINTALPLGASIQRFPSESSVILLSSRFVVVVVEVVVVEVVVVDVVVVDVVVVVVVDVVVLEVVVVEVVVVPGKDTHRMAL